MASVQYSWYVDGASNRLQIRLDSVNWRPSNVLRNGEVESKSGLERVVQILFDDLEMVRPESRCRGPEW